MELSFPLDHYPSAVDTRLDGRDAGGIKRGVEATPL